MQEHSTWLYIRLGCSVACDDMLTLPTFGSVFDTNGVSEVGVDAIKVIVADFPVSWSGTEHGFSMRTWIASNT
jgi:hypothetical protein